MGRQKISFKKVFFLYLAFALAVLAIPLKTEAGSQREQLSSVRQVQSCFAGFSRPRSLSDLVGGFDLKSLSFKGLSQNFWLNCADAKFEGESTKDSAGHSVSGIGDVNGDGFDDLLIGAPQEDSEEDEDRGAVYLFLGPLQGPLDLSQADLKFVGQGEGEGGGTVVAGAGDVNADGLSDFLIGAPAFYNPTGHAYLFYGDPNFVGRFSEPVVSLGDADVVIEGGWGTGVVAGAGDVNGDGYHDVLIGSPLEDTVGDLSGAAYLFWGPLNSNFYTTQEADVKFSAESSQDLAGVSVSQAGDVNGDGFSDLLIGAVGMREDINESQKGLVYLIFGGTDLTSDFPLSQAAVQWSGEQASDLAYEVSTAGDVDGDGYDDILIGAYGSSAGGADSGAAYLIPGMEITVKTRSEARINASLSNSSFSTVKFVGESANDWAGVSVSEAGDVNADGFGDFLIGAPTNYLINGSGGAAYLVLGKPQFSLKVIDLSQADVKFIGNDAHDDHAGVGIAPAGDVNGDGVDDILIGAPLADVGSDRLGAGAAYLVFGIGSN